MFVVDRIVIYEAMLGDFPSLVTPLHTGESHALMVVLQLFINKQSDLRRFLFVGFLLGV